METKTCLAYKRDSPSNNIDSKMKLDIISYMAEQKMVCQSSYLEGGFSQRMSDTDFMHLVCIKETNHAFSFNCTPPQLSSCVCNMSCLLWCTPLCGTFILRMITVLQYQSACTCISQWYKNKHTNKTTQVIPRSCFQMVQWFQERFVKQFSM